MVSCDPEGRYRTEFKPVLRRNGFFFDQGDFVDEVVAGLGAVAVCFAVIGAKGTLGSEKPKLTHSVKDFGKRFLP